MLIITFIKSVLNEPISADFVKWSFFEEFWGENDPSSFWKDEEEENSAYMYD